jgi:hypothetical protein
MSDLPAIASPKNLVQSESSPDRCLRFDDRTLLIDYGKAAFGTLVIPVPEGGRARPIVVHLGEKLDHKGRIDRNPPGSVRYCRLEQVLGKSAKSCRLIIPPDQRNTGPASVRMPECIGEVYPFRYAEIEEADGIDAASVLRIYSHYPFNDQASSFGSSDQILDSVWDLCKHTIKATTFCGLYVDGDRERIPYEGDAYINQLGHYCVDQEYTMARATHEYLLRYPTWPTEWQMHSVMMAWRDYQYTGDKEPLAAFYDVLRVKSLIGLRRDDGLISTETGLSGKEFEQRLNLRHDRYFFGHGLKDLVDWPPGSFTEGGQGERDGCEMMKVNTVVNAFHYRALVLMSRISGVLGFADEQASLSGQAALVKDTINRLLFDPGKGVYVDGEGSGHSSLHSNMFMLAFDAVPAGHLRTVMDFVKSRGMACSVYGAQHLLDALYRHGESEYAFDLLTARHDRGWRHMIEAGSTMTWEAWDWKYKNNLDWNHAWGAAPANIIMRWLMGVRPLEPGFRKAVIQPQPAALRHASAKVPTARGPVSLSFQNDPAGSFRLDVVIPEGMTAKIGLPLRPGVSRTFLVDRMSVQGFIDGRHVFVDDVPSGRHVFELRD